MYADDTSITFTGNDVDEMNNCINVPIKQVSTEKSRCGILKTESDMNLNTEDKEGLVICCTELCK